jgi:hypothetical protein
MRHFNRLLSSGFSNLLKSILEKTKSMYPKFFKSLNHVVTILEKSFALLDENQLPRFDSASVENFINGGEE